MRRRQRRENTFAEDLAEVGLVAGGVALATAGIASLYGSRPRQPFIVGGVDLSNVDFSHPFWVNFSVPMRSRLAVKRDAFERLKAAFFAFSNAWPTWLINTNIDIHAGVFQIFVTPVLPQPTTYEPLAYDPFGIAPSFGSAPEYVTLNTQQLGTTTHGTTGLMAVYGAPSQLGQALYPPGPTIPYNPTPSQQLQLPLGRTRR